ncbi:MAG: hypothetical protein JSW07_19340 [bacterium]|nr:MAG: hypothetical protein JSW07_19340 [bacterium]
MPERTNRTNKKLLEKWQTWVTLAIAILTLMTLLVEVPQKISGIFKSDGKKRPVELQTLAGTVWDEESDQPLTGVTVYLEDIKDKHGNVISDTTDWTGRFELKVKAPYRTMMNLVAIKEGFETSHGFATLGNTNEDIILKKQKK